MKSGHFSINFSVPEDLSGDESEIGFEWIRLPGAELWVFLRYPNLEVFLIFPTLQQLSPLSFTLSKSIPNKVSSTLMLHCERKINKANENRNNCLFLFLNKY